MKETVSYKLNYARKQHFGLIFTNAQLNRLRLSPRYFLVRRATCYIWWPGICMPGISLIALPGRMDKSP